VNPEILFCSDFAFGYHNPEAETKMAHFAARGYDVHYVEHLGIRNPRLRPRHLARARALVGSRGGEEAAPFDVVSPRLLLPRRAPLVDRVNGGWLVRQLLSRVEDPGRTILWIRFPTPELVPVVEAADWRLVVYELVDDHAGAPGWPARLRRLMGSVEQRILDRTSVVFAWSEPIRDRLATLHPNVVLAPPAVDLEAFASAAASGSAAGRVACYTGSFDARLDAELTASVAERLPDWSFVLAGGLTHTLKDRLLALPNIRSLGVLPIQEVPGVLAGADVCLMPYRQDTFTETLFPIKLIEYLAAGKPVVSTPLRASRDYADVVALVPGAPEFADALVAAARADSPELRERRMQRARPFSWEARIDQMEGAIEAALRGTRP
jgi:UDP-galactopyranose mutase